MILTVFTAIIFSQEDNEPSTLTEVESVLQQSSDLEEIKRALVTEDGCDLPCFLGLYPGITSSEAVLKLASLDFERDISNGYTSRFTNTGEDEDEDALFVMDLIVVSETLSELTITFYDANEWL